MEDKTKKFMFYLTPMFICFWYLLIFLVDNNTYKSQYIGQIMGIVGSFIALVSLYSTTRRAKNYEKCYWFFLCLIPFSYIIGEIFCIYYGIDRIASVPNIKWNYYIFGVKYLLFLIGLLSLSRGYKDKSKEIRILLDTFIVMAAFNTFLWYYIAEPIYLNNIISFRSLLILTLMPVGDIGVFSAAIYGLNRSEGIFSKDIFLLLMLGFMLELGLNLTNLVRNIYEIDIQTKLLEPLYSLTLLFIALSGEKNRRFKKINMKNSTIEHNFVSSLIPYIGLVFLLITLLFNFKDLNSIMIGIILVSIFVTFRQVLAFIENKKLFNLLKSTNKELEVANEALRHFYNVKEEEAKTDFLTGLYNRRFIEERFEEILSNHNSTEDLSALMVDIDYFKKVNDTFGHDIGDIVLKEVSNIMKKNIRGNDVLIRFGGEEFICFLPNTSLEIAKKIAERLRSQIESYEFNINDISVNITVSIGIAKMDLVQSKKDINYMIIKADKALYEAKQMGRNRIVVGE